MEYCVITFASAQGAIAAQKTLELVCPVQVMPVLREISRGCGIAVRFAPEHLNKVLETLEGLSLPGGAWAVFRVTGGGRALATELVYPR